MQHATDLLTQWPAFKPTVESIQLPGMPMPANLLMFKGPLKIDKYPNEQLKLKIILTGQYPFMAPKVYID